MVVRRSIASAGALLLTVAALMITVGFAMLGQRPSPQAIVAEAPEPALTAAPTPSNAYLREFFEQGMAAQHRGDYDQATVIFSMLLLAYTGRPESVEATYQLGVVAYLKGDYESAAQAFGAIRAQHSDHPRANLATYWLAEGLTQTGQQQAALGLYQEFISAQPAVEDYVRLRRTVLLLRTTDDATVLRELSLLEAAPTSPQVSKEAQLLHAQALMRSGAYTDAAAKFQALVNKETGGQRLSLLHQLAESQQQAGRLADLLQTRSQIVRDYPASAGALTILESLGAAADTMLTPYQIGRSYYFHYLNDRALAEFQRQRQAFPSGVETPWARYRTAIIYERNSQNEQALQELAAIVTDYPATEAAQEAQWEYGWLLDYLGRYQEAASARQRFRALFPTSRQALDSLIEEALTSYRAGNFRAAVDLLSNSPAGALTGEAGARAQFWKAKALDALGDKAGARQAYMRAALQDPGSYYAFRSMELQQASNAAVDTAAPLMRTAATAVEKSDAAGWLTKRLPSIDAVAIEAARTAIAADRNVERAELFHAMGQWSVAAEEYRTTVREHQKDAAALFALASLLHERDQYGPAILAVIYLQELTAAHNSDLPILLLKVLYPTPYLEQVERAAKEYAVDPLLLYALMRQESLFNPWAMSSAEARGLTQVIPGTGKDIAARLGVLDFRQSDLYRPALSIRFGSYYLSQQLATFGKIGVALAAYNGGAGNAQRWGGSNPGLDPDLFMENIDYQESRSYVRLVQENLGFYKKLYRAG